MSFLHQSVLTKPQEKELKTRMTELWKMRDSEGNPLYTGMQIAELLGFEKENSTYHFVPKLYIYYYRSKFKLPTRRDYRGYPHRYKNKREEPLDLTEQINTLDAMPNFGFNAKRYRAFNILIFWTGLRASEIILLKTEDITISADRIRINAFRLKKDRRLDRKDRIYPLELRTSWAFVDELKEWFERYPNPTDRPFEMHRSTAWTAVKVLNPDFYPHMYRFNRITALCDDPRFSITEIRAWTGLHLVTINFYISKSKRYAEQVADKMTDSINEQLKKGRGD